MNEQKPKSKSAGYTVVDNYFLRDDRLSLKAKGLLVTMLSLPNTWVYSVKGLTYLSTDGKAGINSAIKELERYGYLIRKITRNDCRITGTDYDISSHPRDEYVIAKKKDEKKTEKEDVDNYVEKM